MFCPNCGRDCEDANYCPICGVNLLLIEASDESGLRDKKKPQDDIDTLLAEANQILEESNKGSETPQERTKPELKDHCPKCGSKKVSLYRSQEQYYYYGGSGPSRFNLLGILLGLAIAFLWNLIDNFLEARKSKKYGKPYICHNCGHIWFSKNYRKYHSLIEE